MTLQRGAGQECCFDYARERAVEQERDSCREYLNLSGECDEAHSLTRYCGHSFSGSLL